MTASELEIIKTCDLCQDDVPYHELEIVVVMCDIPDAYTNELIVGPLVVAHCSSCRGAP